MNAVCFHLWALGYSRFLLAFFCYSSRINKKGSQKDAEQKKNGNYFFYDADEDGGNDDDDDDFDDI